MGDTSPKSSGGGKYTPPAKRTGDDDTGAEEAIVPRAPPRTGGVPIQYPMLTDSNYGLWAAKMKILLRPYGVWPALEGTGEFNQSRDDEAFAKCTTAHEAWEAIRRMRVGEDRVKKEWVKQFKR